MRPLIILGVLLFFWAAPGCTMSSQTTVPKTESAGSSGSKYRFSLPDTKGMAVTLDGLLENHKAILINFWATWCPYCIEEFPQLVELQDKYKDRSFTVVAINSGEPPKRVAAFTEKAELNFPVLIDYDQRVSTIYGILGLPTTFLVRSDGKILGVYHEMSAQLVADIEQVLAD